MDKADKGENMKRSANFSPNEISTLIELVEKYKNLSKSNKPGRVRASLNINKWKEIEKEFNNQSEEIYRPYIVLKKKYQNLKNQGKKKIAKTKKETDRANKTAPIKTQEPEGSSSIADFEQQLRKIIEPQIAAIDAFASGNPLNINDILNDTTKLEDEDDTSTDFNQVPMTIPMPMPLLEQFNPSLLWGEYSKLRTNKSRKKNGQLEPEDMSSGNAQRKLTDESLKLLKEEHKLKMKILKAEHEQKMIMMKEEHELKIKLLQAQLENNKSQKSM